MIEGTPHEDNIENFWQAAVQDKNSNSRIICVATIISRTKLVTAANCTHRKDYKKLQIRVAAVSAKSGKVFANLFVKEHNAFDPFTLENNIAVIILLSDRLKFGPSIGKVILPIEHDVPVGSLLYVSTWCSQEKQKGGSWQQNHGLYSRLTHIVDHTICNGRYERLTDAPVVTNDNICSNYIGSGCRNQCNEDAGG